MLKIRASSLIVGLVIVLGVLSLKIERMIVSLKTQVYEQQLVLDKLDNSCYTQDTCKFNNDADSDGIYLPFKRR